MVLLALGVRWFVATHPVVARTAPGTSLLPAVRAIHAKPFSGLATYADLPRFSLAVTGTDCALEDPRERVTAFLRGVMRLSGIDAAAPDVVDIDLTTLADASLVSWALPPVLDRIAAHAHMRVAASTLRLCTQSVLAPFVVLLKRSTADGPCAFNSVPNTWLCSVARVGDAVVVRHSKRECSRDNTLVGFEFRWAVDYVVSLQTGELMHAKPMVLEVDVYHGDEKMRQVVTNTLMYSFR